MRYNCDGLPCLRCRVRQSDYGEDEPFFLELQRDWTRQATYEGARGIVEAFGGGYGIGLAYAQSMLHHA
jgi:hypothetical protein